MTREGVKVLRGTILAAACALAPCATQAVVNPFGDSIFWWRGGRDGANGCAADGQFTQGELVDTRHAKDTTFWNQGYSTLTKDGAANNTLMPYLSETVTAPYACESYPASVLYFPQTFTITTNYTDGVATTVIWRPQQISRLYLPKIFRDSCANGACSNWTAFVRFRRDGLEGKTKNIGESFMLIDYDWGGKRGVNVRLSGADTTQESAQVGFSIGGQYQPTWFATIKRGQWMDLAFSVSGRTLTACWCVQDGKFGTVTYDYSSQAKAGDTAMSANSSIFIGTDNNLAYNTDSYSYDIAAGTGKSLNNAMLAFRGAVAQLAFWDRALDVQEMREVLGYPRPAAMTAGVKDGGTAEYLATAASAAAGTGSWEDLDPALAAGASRTVTFTLDATKASLPQLLRIFPAAGSASGRISVTLNGQSVASGAFDGTRTFRQFVKAKFFASGANTLTVRRTDAGTDDLLIDAMELSGSYIVGRDSNLNNVFSHEDYSRTIFDFDVACGAETNLVAGTNPRKSHDCRLSITFPLDAETLKAASCMTYLTRLVSAQDWNTADPPDFPASRFEVNGQVIKEYGNNEFPKAYGYLGPFDIPLEYLKEGTNTFTFSSDYIGGSTSKWRSFSFHRFELQPADVGTMFLLR